MASASAGCCCKASSPVLLCGQLMGCVASVGADGRSRPGQGRTLVGPRGRPSTRLVASNERARRSFSTKGVPRSRTCRYGGWGYLFELWPLEQGRLCPTARALLPAVCAALWLLCAPGCTRCPAARAPWWLFVCVCARLWLVCVVTVTVRLYSSTVAVVRGGDAALAYLGLTFNPNPFLTPSP